MRPFRLRKLFSVKRAYLQFAARWIALKSRSLVSDCHGAEIAETAVVLPMAFMMLFAVFWFGQAFSLYGAITHAARMGARAGAAPYCSTCVVASTTTLNAYTAVQNALQVAKLDPSRAQWPSPQPTLVSCADGTPQLCSASPGNVCVQDGVQLSNTGNGGAGACGISVSFRYPYQFWLPFTSQNNRRIWLTAQARMRLETR